jgi:hypothetical protein
VESYMDQETIIRYIADTFKGVDVLRPGPGSEPAIAIGDTFFSYDPDGDLAPEKKFPFATIVTKDYGEFDNFSNLDREGVFRLNIGVSRKTYERLFGTPPGPVATDEYNFAAFDHVFPHPLYSPQAWVSVVNPGEGKFEEIKPLIAEAYERAVRRYGA